MLFSIVAVPVYIPTARKIPFSPYPHQYLLLLDFFNNNHSKMCDVISHCAFDLQSPDSDVE